MEIKTTIEGKAIISKINMVVTVDKKAEIAISKEIKSTNTLIHALKIAYVLLVSNKWFLYPTIQITSKPKYYYKNKKK